MKWPFSRKPKRQLISPVVLTEEEQRECNAVLQSIEHKNKEGEWVVRKDIAESFERNMVAVCLMGRAERFAMLSKANPEYKEQACQAAAKACAVFPFSVYMYDFGCILEDVGRPEEAREAFAEFLRRLGTEGLDPVKQFEIGKRNLDEAVARARQAIESRVPREEESAFDEDIPF